VITNKESTEKVAKLLKTKFSLAPTIKDDKVEAFIEESPFNTFSKVMNQLVGEKLPIISISMHLPTMDDVFIKLTGSSLRDKVGDQKSDRSEIMFKR
jgi:hypothetical protein